MRRLSDIGEFGLIDRIRRRVGAAPGPGVAIGIGDDAAVLRLRAGEDAVVTTDALVEDVHFRWRLERPEAIGRRALAANLSDLAAMGARPVAFTFALAAPASLALARFDGVLAGLLRSARAHGCPLVGGNVTRARETSLSIAAIGAVRRGRALRRDAARPGDRLLVTGVLGAQALARLRAERRGGGLRRVPEPRLAAGRALARLPGRGACIDVSDGLAADLRHLLEGRRLGAEVDPEALPRPRGFEAACRRLGADPRVLLLGGGEDYELLFTLRRSAPGAAAVGRRLGVPVREIGRITRRPGVRGLGPEAGWRHF